MKPENTHIKPLGEELDLAATRTRKRYVRSLEYELIASLALQQFGSPDGPMFEKLLAIPLTERVPGHIEEYGLKRMQRLLKLIIQEFVYSVALPKSRKLTDTQIAVCACDLVLAAHEDQLSLEDFIVFFEGLKDGHYGRFKGQLTHWIIMQKLEQYRQLRFEAFQRERERILREREVKRELETRIAPEPTPIGDLFGSTEAKVVSIKGRKKRDDGHSQAS